jgi:hypothetical protein
MLAVASMVPSLLTNASHPVLAERDGAIWTRDRIAQMSIGRFQEDVFLRKLDRIVPADAAVLFVGAEDSWDYPLFGEHRTRRIVRVAPGAPPRDPATLCVWLAGEMRRHATPYAIFADAPGDNPAPPPQTHPMVPVLNQFVLTAHSVDRGCGHPAS